MRRAFRRCALAAAWAGALALLGAPAISQAAYRFPDFRDAAEVRARCDRTLQDLRAMERELMQAPSDAGYLARFDRMTQRVEDGLGPLWLLSSVHPDKAIRDAADACDRRQQAFSTEFYQNARIYRHVNEVVPADPIDARYRRELLDDFEDAGVALPPVARRRAQAISQRINQLNQDFERQIQEDRTQVPFTPKELDGVPPAVWQKAPRDAQGRVLLGLDYPTSIPVLDYAHDPAARERMWRARLAQGGEANLKRLDELARLRREYAQLFGFRSYADFQLRHRMAGSLAQAQSFLGEVAGAVKEREVRDLAELRAAKARHLGTPPQDTTLRRWDVAYYMERLRRERYELDQEAFRKHFPPEASLRFVFALASRLFGVEFRPSEQSLWHPDARAYTVHERRGGAELGTLFVDLYPRPDKYRHAAVWSFRNVSTLEKRQPAAALVTNFNREGLTLEELQTLLHEFGHALHSTLSRTRYAGQGGTRVLRDFVEAPSQMLEDWVFDERVLALMREVCAECPPVPPALLARADEARHFAKGLQVARQHLFASYDLALYGERAAEPLPLWAGMEAATPLGHVSGTRFPANFGHIAGGYAAGYYGYLWSLVLAEDLRTAFADRLDPAVGRRYRETILEQGGQKLPQVLVEQFLGRPPSREPFFRYLER
ncbi:M3 family metallopeptidase [Caldimonas tepidiphila]|uniref:M3 family metallopeptidase n=1 Tax=Caldimonas tepidiphila TaxID=2315841 RepID=UPI000E5ADC66|nr:M3 family metallopeptidase [Caldimonas tepidiphila]